MELDATEFCSDELRKKLVPVRDTLRDLHKDASDRERARKRMKTSAASPDDVAGGNAGEGGFGAGKGEATGETKEEAAAAARYSEKIPDWNEALKDKLDPEIMKDEGCNPSGLYELMAVITHQGASADSGHYCTYVKKEGGDGKTWYFFNDDVVTEVDQQKVETLYGGGWFFCPLFGLRFLIVSRREPLCSDCALPRAVAYPSREEEGVELRRFDDNDGSGSVLVEYDGLRYLMRHCVRHQTHNMQIMAIGAEQIVKPRNVTRLINHCNPTIKHTIEL